MEEPQPQRIPTAADLETVIGQFPQERPPKAAIIQVWLDNYQQHFLTAYGIGNMPLAVEQSLHLMRDFRAVSLGKDEFGITMYPKKPSSWAEGFVGGDLVWMGSRVFNTGLIILDKGNVMVLSVQRHLLGFSSRKRAYETLSEGTTNDSEKLREYQAGDDLFRKFRKRSTPSPEAFAIAILAHMLIDVTTFWFPAEQYQVVKTREEISAAKNRSEDTTKLQAKLEMLHKRANFPGQLEKLGISATDFIQDASREQMLGVPTQLLQEKTRSLVTRVVTGK